MIGDSEVSTLDGLLLNAESRCSPQVFLDFDEFRSILLFFSTPLLFSLQLVQPLLPLLELQFEGRFDFPRLLFLLPLSDQLVSPPVLQHSLQFGFVLRSHAPLLVHEQLSVEFLVTSGGFDWIQELLGPDEVGVAIEIIGLGHETSDVRGIAVPF